MPRPTAADRARERAQRENLAALLIALQRASCERRGVPVPTKNSDNPEAVARLRLALMRYAKKPDALMRDVRQYLVQSESAEPGN